MFGNYTNPYMNNPYAVQYQPQVQAPQPVQQPTQMAQNNNSSIIWVQGEAGAKSYLIAPNTSLMLMDSEGDYFYIKSTDNTGMPTLKKFAYNEITNNGSKTVENGSKNDFEFDPNKYITREEFEREMAKIGSKNDVKTKTKKEVEE